MQLKSNVELQHHVAGLTIASVPPSTQSNQAQSAAQALQENQRLTHCARHVSIIVTQVLL